MKKPRLNFWQIINMNVGFFGIQYSFSLQQNAVNPIYKFLGAENGDLPILQIAGPVTGLLIQPLIGSWSDQIWHPKWGRRKPFFLIGALLCSLGLFLFPFSSALWMAVGLLWILDAANNTAMEPFRAFVADKLDPSQHALGYQAQSFFTGLGQCLAPFTLFLGQSIIFFNNESAAGIPYWVFASFFLGSICSIISMWWTHHTTNEISPNEEEILALKKEKFNFFSPFINIIKAIKKMPNSMWKLALVYLFQWFALKCYWDYRDLTLASTLFNAPDENLYPEKFKEIFKQTVAFGGWLSTITNIITFTSAFLLVWFAKKIGPKLVHSICLLIAMLAFFILPYINTFQLVYLPIIGFGIAWACIMGIPYLLVVNDLPKQNYGVYVGLINVMICLPMLIYSATFGAIFTKLLDSQPRNALFFGGILLFIASLLTLLIKPTKSK